MSAETPSSSRASLAMSVQAAEQSDAAVRLTLKPPLDGRFMRADGSEYACKLWRISSNNADFILTGDEISIQNNDHIIAYVDSLGRLEGNAISIQRDDFTLQLIQSVHQKNKLAAKINWLSKNTSQQSEQRRHARHTPARTEAVLLLDDGSEHACKILDLSLSGAAIATNLRPALRSIVILGNSQAKVMRHFEDGIGIEFLVLQTVVPKD